MKLLLLLALLCVSASSVAAGKIRFAPEKDYGPFVYQAADGKVVGLSIDILEALKPGLDSPVQELPPQPLSLILEAAQRGEVDLISSLRPTPERSAYLAFTSPYVQVPAVLVVRQSVSPAKLSDLHGQRVAVGKGYAVEAFVRQTYPLLDWQAVPDDLTALQGLMAGHYQAVVADIASVSHLLRQQQVKGVQVSEAVGFDYPLSFAYRKTLPQLGRQLEAGLQRLDDGTRQKIVSRWVDVSALEYEDKRRQWLRWAGLLVAAVAAAALSASYLLRSTKGAA
ncbi:MAG: transporter substrate-binding domain-containing protein [Acidovorax sp.]|jgi:ABC-type amino acid transport substrate-binding protein